MSTALEHVLKHTLGHGACPLALFSARRSDFPYLSHCMLADRVLRTHKAKLVGINAGVSSRDWNLNIAILKFGFETSDLENWKLKFENWKFKISKFKTWNWILVSEHRAWARAQAHARARCLDCWRFFRPGEAIFPTCLTACSPTGFWEPTKPSLWE